ncbi:hypothetical protein V492_06265 [Pseudogymnoascus sp. VKM F-4246]|nr:hypothetical protein V492_06265 [Pseudogymnoascus sp. VKM F-4246]
MLKEKRTNSLAFAQTDCHSCASAGRQCDRRRPQCSTCLGLGVKCGGFATPLSWDNNRIWLGQPSQKTRYIYDSKKGNASPKASKASPRAFRFVDASSRRKRRRKVSPVSSPDDEVCNASESPEEVGINSYLAHPPDSLLDDFDPLNFDDCELLDTVIPNTEEFIPDWMPATFTGHEPQDQMILTAQPSSNSLGHGSEDIFTQSLMELLETVSTHPFENHQQEPSRLIASPARQLPPETSNELIPNQIGNQHERLFQMWTWSKEASEHRKKAVELLDTASKSDQVTRIGLHVLEPILVMFTLDCTLSATGPWTGHLMRVRSVLDACGGPLALDNSRVRSQVGMLFWWDATLALISRQGIIIDQSYLDHLILSQGQDEWSFYDLTGCPGDLFVHLVQLAELAKQRELAACMAWLTFDLSPVIKIENQIQQWRSSLFADAYGPNFDTIVENASDSDAEADIEERFHAKQDRYHCAEAWRYALLIYIERVFRWDRKCSRPLILTWLVRKTMDHVRCCRRTSQTQKQLLLPVFLAGSEMTDEEMRGFARQYCEWWANKSRYNMFNSVSSLLEDIWEEGHSNAWWGSVIDRKTRSTGVGDPGVQYLFG